MDLRRLRAGEWIVGLSGLALLVSLFLPWYGDVTAWEAFAVLDVILALIGLAALAVPVVTAVQRVEAVPLAFESLTTLLGIMGLVLVVIRVLNLPGDLHGREWGLWVALAAALGIVGGGLVAMRDERLAGAPEPEIEKRPAPRPEAGS
jgi:hypothetical protein